MGEATLEYTREKQMSLFKIVERIMELSFAAEWAVDEEEAASYEKQIDNLIERMMEKFDNTVYVLKNLKNQAEYFRKLSAEFQRKAQVLENKVERIKSNLIRIAEYNPNAIVGNQFKGTIFQKASVAEVDLDRLPDKYKDVKTVIRPKKKEILNDWSEYGSIPGAEIKIKKHIRIV